MFSKLGGFQEVEALADCLSLCLVKKWMDEIEVYGIQGDQFIRPRDQKAPLCLDSTENILPVFSVKTFEWNVSNQKK